MKFSLRDWDSSKNAQFNYSGNQPTLSSINEIFLQILWFDDFSKTKIQLKRYLGT